MNVLIIEDEIKTAKELKRMIENIDDTFNVIDILPSVRASIDWFNSHPSPDLVFSDIQLADGLSFDIYRAVPVQAPVIFCTAFDEYIMEALRANSIDYLLKPIDEEKLQQSLEKYQNLKNIFDTRTKTGANGNPAVPNPNLPHLAAQLDNTFKRTLLVHIREKIVPIRTTDISFIHAANGLVQLTTMQEHKYVLSYTMEQLETLLDPQQFFRANRQFLINREAIHSVEHFFNRRLFVKTTCVTPEKVIISKVRSSEFLQWMEQ